MGIEIERKFLVQSNAYKKQALSKTLYRQGYLKNEGKSVVRVRITDEKAFITIKGRNKGIVREEFEYEIPVDEANKLLFLCEGYIIEKYRYKVKVDTFGLIWEVDEFLGMNKGLVVAEIELINEQQPFTKPDWLGNEIVNDERYFNSYLSQYPYSKWK